MICTAVKKNMARLSKAVSAWVTFMFLVRTGAQDVSKCPKYVREGDTLDCTCLGVCSVDATVTPTWPGHANTSNHLVVPNINRQRDGDQFVCQLECGGQTSTSTYTLQVAYGPGENDTVIVGPSPFITFNGTQTLTLTCNATANPTPEYRWYGISCENGNTNSTCRYTPNITEDGKAVVCAATNPPKTVQSDLYKFNFSYPPQAAPEIAYSVSDAALNAGAMLTCTVTGGKPLVSTVSFYCDTSYQDQNDVRHETAVSTSLVIDTSQVTEDNVTCYCSAVWAIKPDLYTLVEKKTFPTQYPAKVRTFILNDKNDSLTVTESERRNVTVRCEARGRPGPGLLLSRTSHDGTVNLTEIDEGDDNVTVTSLDHNITAANSTDMGIYTCVTWNGVGMKNSSTITLNVNSQPRPVSEEGRDRNTPLNMTEEGIQIDLRVYPEPNRFTFTHYKDDTDTGVDVSLENMFTSHATNHGPGNNFMTCFITGRRVPEEYTGVYKVSISNDFGSIDYYFAVMKENIDAGDVSHTFSGPPTAPIVGGVVGGLIFLAIASVVTLVVWKRKYRRYEKPQPRRGDEGSLYTELQPPPFANSEEGIVNYANTEPRPDLSQSDDPDNYVNVETMQNTYEQMQPNSEPVTNAYSTLYSL